MTLWMVRAGRHGEQESTALEEGVVTIARNDLPDLSDVETKRDLEILYEELYPEKKVRAKANEIGQIYRFIKDIKKGDLVALPLKSEAKIAFGKIEGPYQYKKIAENVVHIRPVKWLSKIPRSKIDQDLLYSFGAFMTVCQIERNNAKKRIKEILRKK